MIPLKIVSFAKQALLLAKANSTPIATGAIVLGMVSAVILAVKAGKESAEDIEEAKEELETDELTTRQVIRAVWKRFIPVILVLGLTISCFLYTTDKLVKRCTALSAAYALSESYLKDYMEAAKETVGEKKELSVRDRVMEKQVAKHPIAERGIVDTGSGETLFYDAITTRYFRASVEHVRQVENQLKNIYEAESELKMDDYTYSLGLGQYSALGNYIGWRMSGRYDGSQTFGFDYSSGISPETGEPYCAIYPKNRPTDLTR